MSKIVKGLGKGWCLVPLGRRGQFVHTFVTVNIIVSSALLTFLLSVVVTHQLYEAVPT